MTGPVPAVWGRVVAEGSDPGLLARLVARSRMPGSSLPRLLERARHRGEAGEAPRDIPARLAGDPGPAALEVALPVARTWEAFDVSVACAGDPAYPLRLWAGWPGTGGPLWLGARGSLALTADRPTVAIVGNRRATGYGVGVAAWLAESAAEAGVVVVSGGAVGIDAAAHRAAAPSGRTVVALGCGHDVAYPRAHAAPGGLFERILDAGGALVSEQLPGTAPRPHNVRARNRIVAGLADVVVVVEGGGTSGSLVTASEAAERGIPVMAVPGDVRAPGSAAPHRLLAEGAAPCCGPGDLLAALGTTVDPGDGGGAGTTLPAAVRGELARRWPRPVRREELAAAAGVETGPLLAALTRARVAGEVAESPDGVRLARAPDA